MLIKSMDNMYIKQLEVGNLKNFTYLVACKETKEAIVIDTPTGSKALDTFIKENSLKIKYILNTHNHNDHMFENEYFKNKYGVKIIIHLLDNKKLQPADILVKDNDVIKVGNLELKIIHTPGHTPGGICVYVEGCLFTGDTLFVGDSGRTDLGGGDRKLLGESIRRLMKLPGNTVVYPGHNYGKTRVSTLDDEKKNNVNAVEYGFACK